MISYMEGGKFMNEILNIIYTVINIFEKSFMQSFNIVKSYFSLVLFSVGLVLLVGLILLKIIKTYLVYDEISSQRMNIFGAYVVLPLLLILILAFLVATVFVLSLKIVDNNSIFMIVIINLITPLVFSNILSNRVIKVFSESKTVVSLKDFTKKIKRLVNYLNSITIVYTPLIAFYLLVMNEGNSSDKSVELTLTLIYASVLVIFKQFLFTLEQNQVQEEAPI